MEAMTSRIEIFKRRYGNVGHMLPSKNEPNKESLAALTAAQKASMNQMFRGRSGYLWAS